MQVTGRRFDTGDVVTVEIAGGGIARIEVVGEVADFPWLAPGFVDLQVNGYAGREFSSAELTVDDVAEVARRMDSFGVTRFFPTVTTNSFAVLEHALRTLAAACRERPEVARRVLGFHLEGPFISPIDGPRGAHPLVHCRPPDWEEFSKLQDAAQGQIRLVTLAAEYAAAPAFIRQAVASGVVVALGHTAANSEQIKAAVDAGASLSTHLGNGCHRELPRHPNYLWDQLADDRLTATLIVDGHHLPREVVQSFVRAKTAQRCILVSDLSGWAGCPPGKYGTGLGEIEILEDGRLVVAGQRQLLAGAGAPIGAGVANLMRFAGVSLADAVAMASTRPAERLGSRHELTVGAAADLVLFDLSNGVTVRQTILAGETVYSWPPT